MDNKNTMVPRLRFPEFKDAGAWKEKKLGDLSKILRGGSPRPIDDYITLDASGLNWLKIADVNKNAKYVTRTKERVLVTALSKTREVNPGDLIMSNSMSFGRPYILKIKSCIHDGWIAVTEIDEQANRDYLYYLILSPESQSYFLNNAAGSGVQNLNADIIKLLPVLIPKDPDEQQKIADCLTSIDDLITAEVQKLDGLKAHKKGLMQQLFPAEGEAVPNLRFPEFRDEGAWEEKRLGDILDYQQPTPHLVASVKYDDSYTIPVLTAGKTFLLGYTNETTGIFEKSLPTIIFDDFTTAFKYVDFPFKAKSSAMKMLIPKNSEVNIQFVYIAMNLIHFSLGEHKRYWISEYQWEKIGYPSLPEQQKIADCLTSVDGLITAEVQKLDSLKVHKKGLMQQLFPATDEVNG